MSTATEQRIIDTVRIHKMHSTDLRARQIVDMCVAKALNERGEPDERNVKRYAADIATEAVSALLLYIYDDGEINRLAVERDHYKRVAENALLFTALQISVASICDSDTHPQDGDSTKIEAPLGSGAGPQDIAQGPSQ